DLTIHIRLLQRVILLKTAYDSTAQRLAQVCDISINNKLHHVTPYFATPLNSCKGVIHGFEAGLSTDELMTSLESYQATIINARMMGASESVLIIFEGTSVPYTVLFERVEYRCRPHQPKAAKCERCRAYGHRAINCSEAPTFWRCPTCATPLQQQQAPHPCTPWCYHCGVSLKHTNWNTFRSILASTKRQSESYETWIHAIKQAQTQATKPENTTAPSPQPDPYLTRLWKRRKRILRHINQQPLNHRLRERLDDVNKEIITHCDVLDISNWNKDPTLPHTYLASNKSPNSHTSSTRTTSPSGALTGHQGKWNRLCSRDWTL
ncbi:hypothetical protein HPB47_010535, partial [Ixodes persulcatus]